MGLCGYRCQMTQIPPDPSIDPELAAEESLENTDTNSRIAKDPEEQGNREDAPDPSLQLARTHHHDRPTAEPRGAVQDEE